jgi:nitroimidazol reductase NimA-like FMN-containing flavoprotein (pyridoxamine 5'-phosphate oxidase superfamily)
MTMYHPRRSEKEITDKAELNRLLKEGKYAVIGMAKDGEPYVVSLSYGHDEANQCLYFHCAQAGEKIGFLKSNPNVCATIIEDRGYVQGKCEHAYSSLVIRGTMDILQSIEEKKHGLQVLVRHLEGDAAGSIISEQVTSDKSYDKVGILRLNIATVVGKRHSAVD